MAILNKNNILEILVIALAGLLALIMISLVILQNLGYINNSVHKCVEKCSESNMTTSFRDGICKCCVNSVKSTRKETIIEDRCYEVITNEG